MTGFIHHRKDWPRFRWNRERLAERLAAVRHEQGRLLGRMETLGFKLRQEAVLRTLTQDVLKSSETVGRERVHFEAPAAETLDPEMRDFLDWFNGNAQTDWVAKAGLAHLWFVTRSTRTTKPQQAESYKHPESSSPMRPDVGTQAQFRKKEPPVTYRYDSSLSPALEWDGQNPVRELGEQQLAVIEEQLSVVRSQYPTLPTPITCIWRPEGWRCNAISGGIVRPRRV